MALRDYARFFCNSFTENSDLSLYVTMKGGVLTAIFFCLCLVGALARTSDTAGVTESNTVVVGWVVNMLCLVMFFAVITGI